MTPQRIAFFDFCETLVPFQTGDMFLRHAIVRNAPVLKRIAAIILSTRVVRKVVLILAPNRTMRDWLMPMTRGIAAADIDATARDYAAFLRASFNPEMERLLFKHRDNGARIVVISGGYEEYLRYVFDENTPAVVVGSRLQYCDGVATGALDGPACLGAQKVKRLEQVLDTPIDRDGSWVYSDCDSDAPLFGMVNKNKWLVSLPHTSNGQVNLKAFGEPQ